MKYTYKHTMYAGFLTMAVQAMVINFVPLLFLTFNKEFGLSLSKLTLLITINFTVQFFTDVASAGFLDKIGYKKAVITALLLCSVGLILLAIVPSLFNDAYVGILIADIVYSVGAGIIEVVASPLIEACPSSDKKSTMSLLHSFYAWGHMAVILLSTLFFTLFDIDNWRILCCLWALVPFLNAIMYLFVPIPDILGSKDEKKLGVVKQFRVRHFKLFFLLMICVGASEIAVSQWASAFAEAGLGVSKTVGDLLGPALFAFCMALSRTFFGKFGNKINLDKAMSICALVCSLSYLVIVFSPYAIMGLLGCGLCGLSVGLLWPGVLSRATSAMHAQTSTFALLSLGGDIGCTAGPTIAGFVSQANGGDLKTGILFCAIFPIAVFFSCMHLNARKQNNK